MEPTGIRCGLYLSVLTQEGGARRNDDPPSARIYPAKLAKLRSTEQLSFFCPCEQYIFPPPGFSLIFKVSVRFHGTGRVQLFRRKALLFPYGGFHYDSSRGIPRIPVRPCVLARG